MRCRKLHYFQRESDESAIFIWTDYIHWKSSSNYIDYIDFKEELRKQPEEDWDNIFLLNVTSSNNIINKFCRIMLGWEKDE